MADVPALLDEDGDVIPAAVSAHIERLDERARADAAAFDPPEEPPDEASATEFLRDGAGKAIGLYIHLRTGGRQYRFSEREFELLEDAMNTWFSLYAACYGVELRPAVSIRTAAEAMIDTHSITDVARIVTGVPDR